MYFCIEHNYNWKPIYVHVVDVSWLACACVIVEMKINVNDVITLAFNLTRPIGLDTVETSVDFKV